MPTPYSSFAVSPVPYREARRPRLTDPEPKSNVAHPAADGHWLSNAGCTEVAHLGPDLCTDYLNIPVPAGHLHRRHTSAQGCRRIGSTTARTRRGSTRATKAARPSIRVEWSEGHANSLVDLKAASVPNAGRRQLPPVPLGRLSASRPDGAKPSISRSSVRRSHASRVTRRTTKARPSARGTSHCEPQLVGDPANPSVVCTTCHQRVRSTTPTRGLTAGAIRRLRANHQGCHERHRRHRRASGPSWSASTSGKCVQCHMPPTSYRQRRRAARRQPHVRDHHARRGRQRPSPARRRRRFCRTCRYSAAARVMPVLAPCNATPSRWPTIMKPLAGHASGRQHARLERPGHGRL